MVRKIMLTCVGLFLLLGSAWVVLDTIGENLKGTESRSATIASDALFTLENEGVLVTRLNKDSRMDLVFTIYGPIKDVIYRTQKQYMWTSLWMLLMGIAVIVLAWVPERSKKNKSNDSVLES